MDGIGGAVANPELLAHAREGLSATPKRLSPKWLYDARGSALFERITGLPEYDLTRTETAILRECADDLAALVPTGGALAELGSGASVKTRLLLDAGRHFGAYVPIDISETFLLETAADLRTRYPALDVLPVVADFTAPVALPEAVHDVPKVGFFPGSTIGNVPRATAVALLRGARAWPGARGFVLGADLVKDRADMIAAYDDAQGVTAAFIGNMLHRLNAEADAGFDPDAFRYEATWDAGRARIAMRLVSRRAQTVRLHDRTVRFEADEPIEISASRKFTPDSLSALAQDAGWRVERLLTDAEARFAVAVLA